MRLLRLQDDGDFSLAEYVGADIPPYAILSHTWGADHEEITFKDIWNGTGNSKVGYRKLQFCSKQAANDGLNFFWIDTCCIDKSSSAELAEAINSMFRWYQNAARCYVYLTDVEASSGDGDNEFFTRWKPEFEKSRWFTRGWTLQELLAPASVQFFSKEGLRIGDKYSLEQILHDITGIDIDALRGRAISSFPINERMSWAAKRQTKREEDSAYSLLGIFDIHIPLIYGEGRQKAMNRLLEEIKKYSKYELSILQLPPLGEQPDQRRRRPWTVPFSKDPNFVNRPEILTWVHEKCSVLGSRTALVGIGGVGKSQIAIQYCYDLRDTSMQAWVFWVHLGTRARFEDGYRRIAEAVKMEGYNDPRVDILRLVRSWLCDESNGRWVMVVDNADDSDVLFPSLQQSHTLGLTNLSQAAEPLSDFLPHSPNGSILITSRSRDVAYRLTGSSAHIMEVKPMDKSNALILFRKILGPSADQDDTTRLLEALDYMPLAITQAAAYIEQRAPRMTISRYLEDTRRSDQDRARLLKEDMGDSRRDGRASNSILTTWQISFEYIRRYRPAAAQLLSLMSFFDRQGIPESLLRNRYQVNDVEGNFEEDIHTLISYSLVRTNENGSEFEMHRLVQFSTRKWLELYNEFEVWKELYLTTLDEVLPSGDYANWSTWQKLLPHAEVVMEYQPLKSDFLRPWGAILYKASWYASKKGQYRRAEEMDRLTVDVKERTLGMEHLDTLTSLDSLARVLRKQGKYKEAEEMHRRVLQGQENQLGSDALDTLTSVSNLGSVLERQGKYEEAEAMHRRALEGQEKLLGPEHGRTLTSVSDLGTVLAKQGKYKEAEAMHRRDLEGTEKVLGPDHPDTLTSVGHLGSALWGQGLLAEAEELELRVLETRKRILGEEHPHTLMAMANLAFTFKSQGRLQEALSLIGRCHRARKQALGSEHPETVISLQLWEQWKFESDAALGCG